MKNKLVIIFSLFLIIGLCGCNKKGKDDIPEPTPNENPTEKEHFDYQEVMFDNPSDWPTDTFFISVPAVAAKVDDLTSVVFGDNGEKEIYTLTIKDMDYETFRSYTDKLNAAGFSCSRAGYWLPEKESDLSNNYSQCEANNTEIYLKANWYKKSVNTFNFQMQIANYDLSAK